MEILGYRKSIISAGTIKGKLLVRNIGNEDKMLSYTNNKKLCSGDFVLPEGRVSVDNILRFKNMCLVVGFLDNSKVLLFNDTWYEAKVENPSLEGIDYTGAEIKYEFGHKILRINNIVRIGIKYIICSPDVCAQCYLKSSNKCNPIIVAEPKDLLQTCDKYREYEQEPSEGG